MCNSIPSTNENKVQRTYTTNKLPTLNHSYDIELIWQKNTNSQCKQKRKDHPSITGKMLLIVFSGAAKDLIT